jgi:hypothetical protein
MKACVNGIMRTPSSKGERLGVNHHTTSACVLVLLGGALYMSWAAPPGIGTATARGQFLLDSASVQGNATLLEGSVVETRATPSVLRLQAGPRMTIGSSSRGKVYADRLVLEKGEGRLEGSRQYRIEASSLRVLPESSETIARVAYGQPGKVTVAALSGALRVTTADGVLLAKLEPGMAREFEPQGAGAAAPVSVVGCLSVARTSFLLKDETANLDFDLRGQADLGRYVGQRVAVTGTPLRDAKPSTTGAQVLQVVQVKVLGSGCITAPAAGATPAKAAGVSGTTKAVIAGVAIAAVAGGTALGLTGDEGSDPTISR